MQDQETQDQQVPTGSSQASPQPDWLSMMMDQAHSVGLWGGPEGDSLDGKAQQESSPGIIHDLKTAPDRDPTGECRPCNLRTQINVAW